MGLKQSIARLFGKGASHAAPARDSEKGATAVAQSASDRRPVNIDVYLDNDAVAVRDPSDDSFIADAMTAVEQAETGEPAPSTDPGRAPVLAPRNRQELVRELQKNYAEVVNLVRKVDDHLDTQSHRSERILELAERSARNMDVLPELVEQNRRVADALNDLIELTRDARTRNDAAVDRLNKTAVQQLEAGQRQTAALQSMQSAIHRSNEAEQEMARSISGFNETLTDMSHSTRDLGETIAQLRETDAEREAELARLVSNSQKWLVAAVVFCALMAVIVLGLAINGIV